MYYAPIARKPRILFPGAVYHVILRGNAGHPVFFDDRDRYRFYLFMQYAVEKFACRVHGFCCMTNHVHIVIQTGDISLSKIMQNISLRYTKWLNFTQSRTGHVFQGRFKALLLDADAYLLELIRYIHLNPVRAGTVSSPDEYPWSGHRGYLGKEFLPWLTTEPVLSMFSSDRLKAARDYAKFVMEGVAEPKRNEFHSGTFEGRILGDDNFADKVLMKANEQQENAYTLAEVVGVVCRSYGITEEQLKCPGKARPYAEARALIALLVLEAPGLSLTELGKVLRRDIASLGRSGRRLLEEAPKDEVMRAWIDQLRHELTNIRKARLTP